MPFIGKVNGQNVLSAILMVLLAALALPLPFWMSFGETAQASPAVAKSSAAGGAEPTPTPAPVVSRGRQAHGAKAWHDAGYKGGGSNLIKVGIIDSGFNGFRALMGTELPSSDRVNIHCYKPDNTPAIRVGNLGRHLGDLIHCNGHYKPTMPPELALKDHGTIVAEMLTDVSPEVDLYIANPEDWEQLAATVDWMASHGVAVINHSVEWGFIASGDGNAPAGIPNHPLTIIDKAVEKEILWINAAGNSGESTWYGAYKDPDGDRILSFYEADGNSPEINGINVSPGTEYRVRLRWDAPWTSTALHCRLKVEIIGDGKVKTSVPYQPEGNKIYPYQQRSFTPSTRQTYYLSITSDETTAGGAVIDGCPAPHRPRWIQLQIFSGEPGSLDYIRDSGRTYSGSNYYQIGVPSESDNAGILAVGGAVLNTALNPMPSGRWRYSSRGPTIDGRTKPEIVGATCERRYGGLKKCGTSYAAPHVAGLAALVLHRYKDAWGTKYTPADLANYLKENAVQKNAALSDPNNVWGYGFAMLPNPAPAASFSTAPTSITAGSSQSFTIDRNSNVSSVKVVINNAGDTGKLAFGGSSAACPSSSGSISGSRSKGVAFSIKGCTAGEVTIRLYKANNILLRIHTVKVTLPPPTGLSLSTVSGQNSWLRVAYTRSQSPHRYQFKLEQRDLSARTETWTVVDTNTDSSPPETFKDVVRGYHYRARGRNCQDTAQEDTCGAWSDYTNIIELSNPGIAISGLTGSYIAGDTDHFSVTLSDLTLHQPYTVTLESSQGSVIGFNFRCNYLPSRSFTPVRSTRAETLSFTLQACQIPGTTVTVQSGTVTAKLWKGVASGNPLKTVKANATVTKATGSLSPVPSAITVGQDLTFTVTTNVPNSAGVYITATLSGDVGRTALPPLRNCYYASSGFAVVNGNTITLRGCRAGKTRLTLSRSNSIIQLAAYTVTVAASDTKLSPPPATFTAGHDQTFTLSTDLPSAARIYIAATQVGDPGQITLPPTRGCYHPISGLDAANGNTLTIRGCKAGRATLNIYWANAGVLLKSYTVTVNASNTKLSPTPATFTAGHDQTFTLTTDIADNPGVYVTATVAGDPGQITLPPTRGCYHPISGLSAVNGNTLTLRGCRAGRATITIYRSNSGVLLKSYTVTVAASNTSLSPPPAAFTIGTNQTFTLTTDIANTPGVWVGLNYNSADTGRLVLPSQDCAISSAGTAAVNGSSIALKPCTAGTVTIKVNRSYSSVTLVSYPVTINSS